MTDQPKYEPEVLDQVTPSSIHKLVFNDSAAIRSEFLNRYAELVDRTEKGIAEAFTALSAFRAALELDRRNATVESFLYSAGYSLVAAFDHLVSGYPIAAGHMLRHFVESVAMALLCADEASQVFEAFSAEPRNFDVASVPTRLRSKKVRERLVKLVGFDAEAWELMLTHHSEYARRSHSTQLTIAFQTMLDTEVDRILGGEFDPAKDVAYRSDLRRIASAGESLRQLIAALTEGLAEG